jgi:UMF1 family MFS transporter
MTTTGASAAQAEAGEYGTDRERRGWYWYDWANSAFYTTVITVFFGPYITAVAERAKDASGRIHPLGISIPPGSYFPYVVSASVLLSVIAMPLAGAFADRSRHKRELLAAFAYIGAAATIGLLFVTGGRYLLGGALLIVANVSFGCSVVIYNSFLPQIAEPSRRDAVSSIGWAIGYLGGGLLLAVNVAAVLFKDSLGVSTADVARYSMAAAGLWWAGFTVIPLLTLRNRPPIEPHVPGRSQAAEGLRQLARTVRGMRAYPLTLLFLGAYLVYNDGIQTVITQATVYGTKELRLSDEVLVPTILMVQFLAFGGALALGALAKRIGARKALLISIALWAIVLFLAYLLPARQTVPFIALGGLIGLVLGGSQALSRSLFSQLIPAGKEAEYFGIYEISDRGTSWLGPLLFGVAFQVTGSYRAAIISLVVFFVAGFVLLLAVPIRRAITEAGNTPPAVV